MLSSLIATVDSPTDKELITQLYNTYKQFMYNISMSILGKREDAEDAVQDSFVRIIDNLDKSLIICKNNNQAMVAATLESLDCFVFYVIIFRTYVRVNTLLNTCSYFFIL